jgi:hypothetical protein
VKFIKGLIKKIKGFWNIYGGIIVSTFIAWRTDFSKTTMDTWTSYLVLTLTCISVLTFFKLMLFKQKPNGLADTAAMSQQSVKALRTAVDPVKQGEDLGQTIITTIKVVRKGSVIMTNVKKVLKWLWGNKLTLSSIISNLIVSVVAQYIMYSDALKEIEYFQVHDIAFKVVVTCLCILWLIVNVWAAVNKYGLESLNQLQERSAKLKEDTTNKLSSTQKKVLKAALDNFDKVFNQIETAIAEANKVINTANQTINDLKTLTKVGIALTGEQQQAYSEAELTITNKQREIAALEENKAKTLAQIDKIKSALN